MFGVKAGLSPIQPCGTEKALTSGPLDGADWKSGARGRTACRVVTGASGGDGVLQILRSK